MWILNDKRIWQAALFGFVCGVFITAISLWKLSEVAPSYVFPGFSYHPIYRELVGKDGELNTEAAVVRELNKIFQGQLEYRLKDKTRVDILTDDMAIEVDWASKWYESIGQSVHYAEMTGKKPAIILIGKEPSDEKYIAAALAAAKDLKYADRSIAMFVFRLYGVLPKKSTSIPKSS